MNEQSWKIAAILAMVTAAGGLLFHLIMPIPKPASPQVKANQERKIRATIEDKRDRVTKSKATIEKYVWSAKSDELGAQAMAYINKLAAKESLKVSAFRPQRTQEGMGLTSHPYLVSVEGQYPSVMKFVRTLETKGTKLAVTTVQVASSDGASDQVNATVGVTAFRLVENEKK